MKVRSLFLCLAGISGVWAGLFSPDRTYSVDGIAATPAIESASKALAAGNLPAAKALAAKVIAEQPKLVEAHEIYGVILGNMGDAAGAEREFRTAVGLANSPRLAHLLLGQSLFKKGQIPQAKQQLEMAVRATAVSKLANIYLGRAAAVEGQTQLAISHFEAAMPPVGREGFQALAQLASLYLDRGDAAAAKSKLALCTGDCLATPAQQYVWARIERAEGKFAEAESRLERLSGSDSTVPELWMDLGEVRRLRRNPQGAEEAFAKAGKLPGTQPEADLKIAMARLERGDKASATEQLNALIARKKTPAAYVLLSEVQASDKNIIGAQATLRSAIRDFPKDSQSYLALGMLLWSEKQLVPARGFLEKAVELNPAQGRGWSLLSNAAFTDHRMKEAEDYLRRGLAASPNDAQLHFDLGTLLWHQNRFTRAAEEFEQVLRLQPNYVPAMNNRALLLVRLNRNLDEAENLMTKAVLSSKDDPLVVGNLGWVQVARGKTKDGVPNLEAALGKLPDNPEIHYFLAVAYSKSGRQKEAEPHFKDAYRYGLPLDYGKEVEARDETGVVYRCPMDVDVNSYTPGKCPRCGMGLKANLPKPVDYLLAVTSTPQKPSPGEKVTFSFDILHPETKRPIVQFEKIHEKLFHLFLVSSDLTYFSHEHPELMPDGKFKLTTTLPKEGNYRLVADFYPADGTPQFLMRPITVGSPRPASPITLVSDSRPKQPSNLKVDWKMNTNRPTAGRPVEMSFTLSPGEGVEPFLGAWAHMLIVSDDLSQAIHAHPSGFDGKNVNFSVVFPKKGMYKLWVQFQKDGKVTTAHFVTPVGEAAGAVPGQLTASSARP